MEPEDVLKRSRLNDVVAEGIGGSIGFSEKDIPLPDFIDGPETEFDFFFWDEE